MTIYVPPIWVVRILLSSCLSHTPDIHQTAYQRKWLLVYEGGFLEVCDQPLTKFNSISVLEEETEAVSLKVQAETYFLCHFTRRAGTYLHSMYSMPNASLSALPGFTEFVC